MDEELYKYECRVCSRLNLTRCRWSQWFVDTFHRGSVQALENAHNRVKKTDRGNKHVIRAIGDEDD